MLIFLLFLAVLAVSAQSQEYASYGNDRISVYLHPYSFFTSMAEGPVKVYSTVEIPLSLSNSIIIYPDAWFDRDSDEDRIKDTFRAGSGLGFRYFTSERGEGLYLQAIAGVHYYSIKYNEVDGYKYFEVEKVNGKKEIVEAGTKRKGVSTDLTLYIGNAYKFRSVSVFSDVGVGFGNAKHGDEFYYNNITFDANLGVGLPF